MNRDIRTIQLSESTPHQSPSPYGGYTKGTYATIFETEDDGFGYCYHGVGQGGNAFESEDVLGFATADEAEADARANFRA